MGGLPIMLLLLFTWYMIIRSLFRLLRGIVKASQQRLTQRAALRRSARLKAATRQAQSLIQIAPQVANARSYGEVAGLLANIPGMRSANLNALKALNAAEQNTLDHVRHVARHDPKADDFLRLIEFAQTATRNCLESLTTTPALPAPELAQGWLSFHEETRMSLQEIATTLDALRDQATAVSELRRQLAEELAAKTTTPQASAGETAKDTPLPTLMQDMVRQLPNVGTDSDPKLFQNLFELSQSIDAAFVAANRQPPQKLGLVADDVRRVHQVETLLSVYREKMDKLDVEKSQGNVNDDTYQTMKSAWERMLEGELSALETID